MTKPRQSGETNKQKNIAVVIDIAASVRRNTRR